MSKKSAAEHGTAYQLRNLTGRSNVGMKPKNSMNASEDFMLLVLHSYITTAAMEVLEMSEIIEWPSSIPEDMWLHE